MTAYYNEIEPFAAQWLRNLIAADLIAPGDVDDRSILDVTPGDLAGYTQCHFFAGIGVWSHALRRAGWPDSRPVWTGSCPCQPFSAAGRNAGFDDQRHLWPYWHFLIEQRRPPVVFGEQVEAAIGHGWLDLVQADLEGIGYAFGAAGIPAAGVGAPHIRQRLYFVAASSSERLERCYEGEVGPQQPTAERSGCAGWMGHADCHGAGRIGGGVCSPLGSQHREHGPDDARTPGSAGELADSSSRGFGEQRRRGVSSKGDAGPHPVVDHEKHRPGPTHGFWRAADWLQCRDGKWRPVEPGTFPLAHGAPARVGRLRAYGNAIVAEVAAEFIAAYLECRPTSENA